MRRPLRVCLLLGGLALLGVAVTPLHAVAEGTVSGDLKQWHKVTLTIDGPEAHERKDPNPFVDYRMTVTFTHESGSPTYDVPGYFAADGNAAETSAESGNQWRAHVSPDKTGTWNWKVSFVGGQGVAVGTGGRPVDGADGLSGSFEVGPSDKQAPDFRAQGRLEYVGKHHLRFAGSGEYFLKAGADSPETLLAYPDFDGTTTVKRELLTWQPHVRDWQNGDPTWKGGKGKGLIGALNYLSGRGCNSFSFLTYNAGGDGDNVWPFVERNEKLRYDCSKLDQWQIVFDHGQSRGLYLHFKLQENESDDNRRGQEGNAARIPEALDGGALGVERKLYLRELIARYGYSLALNWNLGEENTQSEEEQRDMAGYIRDTDPYRHNIVVHTFPSQQDKVYSRLVGESPLTGASLQNPWDAVHRRTLQWIAASAAAGKPWVVANDEQNSANLGVPPDPGYKGFSGKDKDGKTIQTIDDIRRATLWGNILAGGAGVEYYFGYGLPQNDLECIDWRSRERSWDYCRVALDFFRDQQVPFWDMTSQDALVGNPKNDNRRYCFTQPGELYLVFLAEGGTGDLDLADASGTFQVRWYNPRQGGDLQQGSVAQVTGGDTVSLGTPPSDADQDWLIVVRK